MSKEMPILFSTPMVRAILDDTKSMTRRSVKPQPDEECYYELKINDGVLTFDYNQGKENPKILCPYGKPGDVLWVRETWCWDYKSYPERTDKFYFYRATTQDDFLASGEKWKPSIFMPKEAARIWLGVINVKVERLQDISWEDAVAEGCPGYRPTQDEPTHQFKRLWDEINGEESWSQNPWVWVIEFKVLSTTGKP